MFAILHAKNRLRSPDRASTAEPAYFFERLAYSV
jgi:hypothetical protein